MADLPYSTAKINDIEVSSDAPVTESLERKFGGAINYILDRDLRKTTFTSSSTWIVPTGVDTIFVNGCGGGGGGSVAGTNYSPGGGGGGGSAPELVQLSVVAGDTLSITVGAGGAGGNGLNGFSGLPGGDSFISVGGIEVLRYKGAQGGTFDGAQAVYDIYNKRSFGGDGASNAPRPSGNGSKSMYAIGGNGGSASGGGGGGGGMSGAGGAGGGGALGSGIRGQDGFPGTGFGCGGGGGGAGGSGGAFGGDGGAGSPGVIHIINIATP
jgi:hypothetical protein